MESLIKFPHVTLTEPDRKLLSNEWLQLNIVLSKRNYSGVYMWLSDKVWYEASNEVEFIFEHLFCIGYEHPRQFHSHLLHTYKDNQHTLELQLILQEDMLSHIMPKLEIMLNWCPVEECCPLLYFVLPNISKYYDLVTQPWKLKQYFYTTFRNDISAGIRQLTRVGVTYNQLSEWAKQESQDCLSRNKQFLEDFNLLLLRMTLGD